MRLGLSTRCLTLTSSQLTVSRTSIPAFTLKPQTGFVVLSEFLCMYFNTGSGLIFSKLLFLESTESFSSPMAIISNFAILKVQEFKVCCCIFQADVILSLPIDALTNPIA